MSDDSAKREMTEEEAHADAVESHKRMADKTQAYHNAYLATYKELSGSRVTGQDSVVSDGEEVECGVLGACVFLGEVLASLSQHPQNYMYSRQLLGRMIDTVIGTENMARQFAARRQQAQAKMLAESESEGEA